MNDLSAPCATAACTSPAVTTASGWPMCWDHATPEPRSRDNSWDHYLLLRTWIARLHHVGLADTEIAAVVGACPSTVRTHRQRLNLPGNRTPAQRIRDDRRAALADTRISRCSCTGWAFDGTCHDCGQAAAS